MAEQNETNVGTTGRKFVSVNGKDLTPDAPQGELKFVRPGKLTDADADTVVAEGIYEGSLPNKYDAEKLDYKVRSEDGTLTILNSCASLAKQMAKVETGSYVQITYLGKKTIEQGKFKGKESHSFVVGIAAE